MKLAKPPMIRLLIFCTSLFSTFPVMLFTSLSLLTGQGFPASFFKAKSSFRRSCTSTLHSPCSMFVAKTSIMVLYKTCTISSMRCSSHRFLCFPVKVLPHLSLRHGEFVLHKFEMNVCTIISSFVRPLFRASEYSCSFRKCVKNYSLHICFYQVKVEQNVFIFITLLFPFSIKNTFS
jgi:hypothetical protein